MRRARRKKILQARRALRAHETQHAVFREQKAARRVAKRCARFCPAACGSLTHTRTLRSKFVEIRGRRGKVAGEAALDLCTPQNAGRRPIFCAAKENL